MAFIPEPCGQGGDCFLPNPEGPGCADLSCCSRVCDLDPFCCGVAWDLQCANIARATCVSCGNPAAGSCFEPRPTPYCDNANCCRIVCEIDPSCCDVMWDKACVAIATSTCKPDPCNRECPGDFNNDRLRDGADLGLLLGGWGEGVAPISTTTATPTAADLGLLLGSLGPCPACGVPDAGGCLNVNVTPGCEDANCCGAVCMVDPACCSDAWDVACAEQAREICPGLRGSERGPVRRDPSRSRLLRSRVLCRRMRAASALLRRAVGRGLREVRRRTRGLHGLNRTGGSDALSRRRSRERRASSVDR